MPAARSAASVPSTPGRSVSSGTASSTTSPTTRTTASGSVISRSAARSSASSGAAIAAARRSASGSPDRGQPAGRDHVVHGAPGQPVQHLRPTAALRGVEPVSTFQLQRQQRHQIAGNLIRPQAASAGPSISSQARSRLGAECVQLARGGRR